MQVRASYKDWARKEAALGWKPQLRVPRVPHPTEANSTDEIAVGVAQAPPRTGHSANAYEPSIADYSALSPSVVIRLEQNRGRLTQQHWRFDFELEGCADQARDL